MPAAATAWLCGAIVVPVTISTRRAEAEARRPCAKTRILFLSDSHGLGHFGEMVERWLVTLPNAEVHTYALGGSSPQWWFRGNIAAHGHVFHSCDGRPKARINLKHTRTTTPLIAELMNVPTGTYEREVVIINQGTNVPGPPSIYKEGSEKLVKAIQPEGLGRTHRPPSGAPPGPPRVCVWITPPKMRDRGPRYSDLVYAAIQEGLQSATRDGAPCQLIDSRKYSDYPALDGDGVHYPFSAAGIAATTRWSQGVISELKAGLATEEPAPSLPLNETAHADPAP